MIFKSIRLIIFLFIFIISNNIKGQEKITLAGGIGFPELANLSVRLNLGQDQFGIGAGHMPDWRGNYYSITLDYIRHFGGYSRLSDFYPWYFRAGIVVVIEEDSEPHAGRTAVYPFLPFRLGREFNISKRFGFSFDIGLAPSFTIDSFIPLPTVAITLYCH